MRLGGPQRVSEKFAEEVNVLPLSGFELRIVRPVAEIQVFVL
jgi:hypothetical protein